MAWSPDGRHLATGSYKEGQVKLWDALFGELMDTLEGPAGVAISPLAWLEDGNRLLAVSRDKKLWQWHADTGRLQRTLSLPALGAFSSDRRLLASVPGPNAIRVWEVETGRPNGTLVQLRNDQRVVISPEGHHDSPRLERELVYLVQRQDGGQETLEPEEFARRFGWKNDPERVRLTGK